MDTSNWITLGIAIMTLVSGWGQFWVKERLFTSSNSANDVMLSALRSRSGVSFIAFTGFLSAASMWLLVTEVLSKTPLTRLSCCKISVLTAFSVINIFLIGSMYTLRKIAVLKEQLEEAEKRLKAEIDNKPSKAYVTFMS
jgi:hypothetical protein